jgi:hypothetical protein
VSNKVPDIKGGIQTGGIRKQSVEKNIWTKKDEVTGGWRKLHNEELHDLCSSPSVIRFIYSWRMRCMGHVARMAEERLPIGKPEGNRPLGRPRHRWIDNIKMALLEIGLGGVDWIGLAQDRYRWRALVKVVMKLRVQ